MKYYFVGLLFLISGCASLSTYNSDDAVQITLLQVENLHIRESSKEDLLAIFGKPSSILKPDSFERWIYKTKNNEQRAAFNIDTRGIVVGALWIPTSNEDFFLRDKILAHFKDSVFKVDLETEATKKHDDLKYLNYSDSKNGISIQVARNSGIVTSVLFGRSDKIRNLATPKR